MLQFIKDSIRELQHVVWPTRKETQKYFGLVLAMLVFFGLYLFMFSNLFSELVFGFKSMFSSSSYTVDSTTSTNIDSILDEGGFLISDEAEITIDPIEEEGEETLSGAVQ